jgi:NAD-dependent deacetylase
VDEEDRLLPWDNELKMGDLDPATGAQLRPHVVWFGEGLPELDRAMRVALGADVDVLIVVGTSLNVYPAAFVATETNASRVIVIDPHPPELPLANLEVVAEIATVGVRQVVERLLAK